jgi:elongation factor Tu
MEFVVNDPLQDIEVLLTFLHTESGGRKEPVFSGYRPQFYYQGDDWDAIHTYIGIEQVNPGDTVMAQLRFLSPQNHVGRLCVGTEFQIREGNRTVATGHVTKILHLEENATRHNNKPSG